MRLLEDSFGEYLHELEVSWLFLKDKKKCVNSRGKDDNPEFNKIKNFWSSKGTITIPNRQSIGEIHNSYIWERTHPEYINTTYISIRKRKSNLQSCQKSWTGGPQNNISK